MITASGTTNVVNTTIIMNAFLYTWFGSGHTSLQSTASGYSPGSAGSVLKNVANGKEAINVTGNINTSC